MGTLAWSDAGASTIVSANSATAGVYLSAVGEPSHGSFLPVKGQRSVTAGALSQDSKTVAIISSGREWDSACGERLAVLHRDGTHQRVIDDQGKKSAVAFDGRGNLWWIEGASLLRWNGSSSQTVAELAPRLAWTITSVTGGRISLAGYSASERRAEFVLLDEDTGGRLDTMSTRTEFTTFLGLV